jgi:hypothetical protein
MPEHYNAGDRMPEGVLLVDATTGLPVPTLAQGLTRTQLDAAPVRTADTVQDSTGQPFSPDACTHTYGYSAGLLVTDTATDGASTWVKTYSYTSGNLTGETKWVKQ